MARISRWDRPLGGPIDRARAWANMLFVDHGAVRLIHDNRFVVGAGRLWRSGQPSPWAIGRFAAAGGRTVVNLRGGREHGSWPLEREACERHGLVLLDFVLRSREAPDRETVMRVGEFLSGLAYPVLVHCKSGADRAGLFAALFLLEQEGASVADAKRQLSWRFGHFRHAKTGILDAFLDAYEREGEAHGLTLGRWAEGVYDPARLTAGFRPRLWSSLLADRLVRRE